LSNDIGEKVQNALDGLFAEKIQDRFDLFDTQVGTDGHKCLAGRLVSVLQDQQTPIRYPHEDIVPAFKGYPYVRHEASFDRTEVNTYEDHTRKKRRELLYSPSPSMSPSKRLRWSSPDLKLRHPLTPQDYPMQTPQDHDLHQNVMTDVLFEEEYMPILTPGHRHSMTCDMGIQIEITPLIPSNFFN
jgi:hypothetical protein